MPHIFCAGLCVGGLVLRFCLVCQVAVVHATLLAAHLFFFLMGHPIVLSGMAAFAARAFFCLCLGHWNTRLQIKRPGPEIQSRSNYDSTAR